MFHEAENAGVFYNRDVETLYEMLPDIIERLGFDCTILESEDRIRTTKDSIFLAWHSYGNTPNVWFVKPSYIPDYFYFDKTGFSGWSTLAKQYDYNVPVTDDMRSFVQSFKERSTSTRFKQTKNPLPKQPYVLVLGQRKNDMVSRLAYFDNLPDRVTEAFKGTKYNVVVKKHPMDVLYNNHTNKWEFSINENAGDLHELISNASAIYTVNSSTGFESLFFDKPVFTAGDCDYHWVSTTLRSPKDIKSSIEIIEQPVDVDARTRFLYYCLTEYFMTINDEKTIERKILKAVEEYE